MLAEGPLAERDREKVGLRVITVRVIRVSTILILSGFESRIVRIRVRVRGILCVGCLHSQDLQRPLPPPTLVKARVSQDLQRPLPPPTLVKARVTGKVQAKARARDRARVRVGLGTIDMG